MSKVLKHEKDIREVVRAPTQRFSSHLGHLDLQLGQIALEEKLVHSKDNLIYQEEMRVELQLDIRLEDGLIEC